MNLKQIQDNLEYNLHHTFGEITDKVKRLKPFIEEKYIESEARFIPARQYRYLISKHSDNEQYRILKDFFKQTINGKPIRLGINRRYQPILQHSPALQKLLKEGFLKMTRENGFAHGLKGWGWSRGWKPYSVKQSYLQLNCVQKESSAL